MKQTVGIIFGGRSSEHEISCVSAANVLSYIDREKYDVVVVGITKEGSWYLYEGDLDAMRNNTWQEHCGKSCMLSPEPKHHGLLILNKNGDISLTKLDVVFPVLHGKNGEDGTMQGLFELAQIPYVGCGVLASSVCMDKIITKELLCRAGIGVTEGFSLSISQTKDVAAVHQKILSSFGYPVVVKPANAGSSVGITLVKQEEELRAALSLADENDRRILIERAVDARELECAVLGDFDHAEASVVGEIVKKTEMYDYETKYITDTTELVIPAQISEEEASCIRETAVRAFHAIDGFGMARVDFFLDRQNGKILINEINTLPGFTNISMYPMLWAKAGVENKELITRLLEIALRRNGSEGIG